MCEHTEHTEHTEYTEHTEKESSISAISLLSLYQWFLPHELSRHSNLPHPKFLIRAICLRDWNCSQSGYLASLGCVILFIRGHLRPP